MSERDGRSNHRGERAEGRERGFTLIEVMISIALTLIVMGAVFGLLTRGQRTFQREPEVADLQQSARAALDMVTKDILQAGAGLPPEFPAFSRLNGAGDNAPTDVLEIIGTFQAAGTVFLEPEDVARIDPGGDVVLAANTTNLEPNDMVLLYNNVSNDPAVNPPGRIPQWSMARIVNVTEDPFDPAFEAMLTLDYAAFDPAYSFNRNGAAPPDPADYVPEPPTMTPKITRVSVVRYFTQPDDPTRYSGPPPQVLMRDVDFAGAPQAVGYLEDFQIAYVIGITAPFEQDNPPDPVVDLPNQTLDAENMLSSVRVTLTARSVTAGMEGASEGDQNMIEDDFIRKTFSTNVNPRNISAGIERRITAAGP